MSSEISFSSELDEALNDLPSTPHGSPSSKPGLNTLLKSCVHRERSRELPTALTTTRSDSCAHEIIFHGICGVCGKVLTDTNGYGLSTLQGPTKLGDSHVQLQYLGGIHVQKDYLLEQHASAKAALLRQRKLGLVLDLDHTLLHSKQTSALGPEDEEACKRVPLEDNQPVVFSTPYMTTKLRPGVHRFLGTLKEHFQLFIYTMGDSAYARNMANLLDPSGSGLFLNRIIDRGDSDWDAHQKGLDKVCAAEMTAVVDDTMAVWQQDAANVLRIQRYFFFQPPGMDAPKSRDVQTTAARAEDPAADQLADIASVLHRLHARFYNSQEPDKQDVRRLLRVMKAETLQDCHVVFSRVIDQNSESAENNPLWQLAVSMGATCSIEVTEATTHCVTLSPQTAKAQAGARLGKHVVSPDWLLACDARWRTVDEADYPAPEETKNFKDWLNDQRIEDTWALRAAGGAV